MKKIAKRQSSYLHWLSGYPVFFFFPGRRQKGLQQLEPGWTWELHLKQRNINCTLIPSAEGLVLWLVISWISHLRPLGFKMKMLYLVLDAHWWRWVHSNDSQPATTAGRLAFCRMIYMSKKFPAYTVFIEEQLCWICIFVPEHSTYWKIHKLGQYKALDSSETWVISIKLHSRIGCNCKDQTVICEHSYYLCRYDFRTSAA